MDEQNINRALSVERTYSLGQYQNIKLFDSIGGLPEDVVFDRELISEVRYLQLIQLEIDYRKYLQLIEKVHPYNVEEAIGYLEEVKVNTLDLIKELFTKAE